MSSPESREHLVPALIALLVVLAPAVILFLTLGALTLFGELALGRLTPLEFVELYLLELVLFAGLAYAIYWATRRLVTRDPPS